MSKGIYEDLCEIYDLVSRIEVEDLDLEDVLSRISEIMRKYE